MRSKKILCYFFMCLALLKIASSVPAQKLPADREWPCYGNDPGGARFSTLTQVNTKNVKNLEVGWTYKTGELDNYAGTSLKEKAAFEATPIMIKGVLYFSTPTSRVIALDALTGKEKWMFDPKIDLKAGYSEVTSRGVSSWPAPGLQSNSSHPRRIFIATLDGRLIALDAGTGKPIDSFGQDGTVDLRQGVEGALSITSPPAVIGDIIIVGSSMGDNQRINYPKGTVRAYHARTGKPVWNWNPIPTDYSDRASLTWKQQEAIKTGAANTWAVISVDLQRGLVFIPTSSPATDYYGGERKGQNLYANSIVALHASTGKMAWHFQVVHHDLWDYDIAAQPVLIDINRDGKKIPAVAVGTKMGHIFILNRETGKTLFPVEEKPVPVSDVDGEEAWATQPFPVLPAPVGLQRISTADAWGPGPQDKEESRKKIAQFKNAGIFTPPSFGGSIMTPGNAGGIHWGGMCYDPLRGLLITNINLLAAVIRMIPREKLTELEKESPSLLRAETGRQMGTPYVMKRDYLFKIDSDGFHMQTPPPWGTLLAVNLDNGSKKWEVPLGYMVDPKKYPDAVNWGSLNFGGAIVTAGGLIFVAATLDGNLRAFNSATGEMLWETALPAGGQCTPMTYAINGKQFVVIAAGGHGKLGTKLGDYIVAFALPATNKK